MSTKMQEDLRLQGKVSVWTAEFVALLLGLGDVVERNQRVRRIGGSDGLQG